MESPRSWPTSSDPWWASPLTTLKTLNNFMDHIKSVHLLPGEAMVSYNVEALFTPVLVDPTISIVQNRLHQDSLLPKRISMFIPQMNCWSFVSKTLTSSSRVSTMNRSMVQPWVPQLWMTPLSSNRQNSVTRSSSTSTPWTHTSNSLLWT